MTARLKPYADRADWSGLFVEADRYLEWTEFGDEPFPWVTGQDWFDDTARSAAWRIAGYGAVAGYASASPYGAAIQNDNDRAPETEHLVLVEPSRNVVWEGIRRRTDGSWLLRTYSLVTEGLVAAAGRLGPEALADCPRTPSRFAKKMRCRGE